jgi:hypothetical protein
MRKLKPASQNAALAEAHNAGVVGWTHVSVTHLVEVGTRAGWTG